MKKIILSNQVHFSIEHLEKKARLVVYQNNKEWVCRKETVKNINAFLNGDEVSIFKGRLQLHKIKKKINVEVKGEVLGTIKKSEFETVLKSLC